MTRGFDDKADEKDTGMPQSSIKDEEQYQALRREGASKENAARISNASKLIDALRNH